MKTSLVFFVVFLGIAALAEVPLTFTYQGKLTDENGVALSGDVSFKIQLQDPSGTCLLYEEQHSVVTLGNGGLFSLSIGSTPTSDKRGVSDPGLTMEKIFSNDEGQIRAVTPSTCPLGYTPASNDKRKMKVTVTNLSSGTVTVLSPLQEIGVSPYALLANKANNSTKFAGKAPEEFVQVEGTSVTQSNVKSLTDKVSEILTLVNGNVTPTASCVSGSFNRWTGSAWVCEAAPTSGSGTITSVTAAATSGNPITVGGTATAPTLDIAKASASASGYLSSTDWSAFNSKLSSINSSQVTTALGYTPIQPNGELTALSGLALNGILQRTGSGAYTALGTTAPLGVTGGNIGINAGAGLIVNGSSQLVPDFGTAAGKVAQGNDSRIVNAVQTGDARLPSSTCASGSFSRWNGSAWVCEVDQTASSGTNNSIITNWPDIIVCNVTNPSLGVAVFMGILMPNQNGKYWYRLMANTSNFDIYYNADGSFSAYANLTTTDCNASISSLQASGKTFNIAKGPAAQWLQSSNNAYYNAGNVGVGTGSPTAKLHVVGSTIFKDTSDGSGPVPAIASAIEVNSNNTNLLNDFSTFNLRNISGVANSFNRISFSDNSTDQANAAIYGVYTDVVNHAGEIVLATRANSGGALSERVRVLNNGDMNLGTSSTGYRLNIGGAAGSSNLARLANSDYAPTTTGTGIAIKTGATTGNTYVSLQVGNSGGSITGPMVLQPTGGGLGIGTTTPSTGAALDVNGSVMISGTGRTISGDFTTSTPNSRARFITSTTNGSTWLTISPNGTGVASGFVATNSNDADNAPYLSVGANATATYINSFALGTGTVLPFNLVVNNTTRLHVTTGGNVGVGTSSPGQKFQVGASGDGTVAIANAWNTFSDVRLKKDFEKIENACQMVDQLNGYYYHWKSGGDDARQIGVIAQEVEVVLPELVKTGRDGIKTVDYPKLTAVLIEANKEQSRSIRQMSETIESLRSQNEELVRRMERVEKALSGAK